MTAGTKAETMVTVAAVVVPMGIASVAEAVPKETASVVVAVASTGFEVAEAVGASWLFLGLLSPQAFPWLVAPMGSLAGRPKVSPYP